MIFSSFASGCRAADAVGDLAVYAREIVAQNTARGGKLHLPRGAVKELYAKFFFQRRDLARERGVRVLVDGAQSACHRPVDIEALGCDWFVCSGHKLRRVVMALRPEK